MAKSSKKLSLGTTAPAPTVLPDLTATIGPKAPALNEVPKDTTVQGVTVSAVPGGHWASVTAKEIAEDDAFQRDMIAAVDADEVSRRKVYTVLNDLHHIFDADEMADWPRLSPTLSESKKFPAGTNIPFLAEYETTKKNKDGKDVTGTGNRYDDLARNLPWIKAWVEYKAYCVDAKKDRTKAKEEHFNWSGYRWDAEIKKYDQRIRNGISMIKTAVKVHFQAVEINHRLPQIGCGLMTEPGNDRSLTDVGEPMAVWSKTESDALTKQPLSTCLSAAAFLALKVDAAIEKANLDANAVTYAMLLASAGRTSKKDTATTEPAIKDMATLEGTLAELLRFLAQEHHASQLRALIAGKDKKGNPLMSDDYVVTINNLSAVIDSITTFPEFAARVPLAIKNVSERALRERGIAPQGGNVVVHAVPMVKVG